MDWKKLGKILLFSHIAIVLILTPVSAVALLIVLMAIYMLVNANRKLKYWET